MKEKIEVVIRAGFISGSMMEKKIRTCPAPSIRAASSSVAREVAHELHDEEHEERLGGEELAGRISGKYVSTRPSLLKTMYCGMITTWNGSSSVAIIAANKTPTPRNLIRANAYAARRRREDRADHAPSRPGTASS